MINGFGAGKLAPLRALICTGKPKMHGEIMIDEQWTWEFYGYHSYDLKPRSNKPIVARCDKCCQYRILPNDSYSDLCRSCGRTGKLNHFFGKRHTEESKEKVSKTKTGVLHTKEHNRKISEAGKGRKHSEETKLKMSKSQKAREFPPMNGTDNHFFGKHHTEESKKMMSEAKLGVPLTDEHKQNMLESRLPVTDETKLKMSEMHKGEKHWCFGKHRSEEVKQKISVANTGKVISEESRRKHSATLQGIPYEEWTGFASNEEYCEKFDDACRERIREKYNRKCFLCNTDETTNKRKLGVHHYDMNKNAGCDGVLWKLVPLCMSCHGSSHTKTTQSRIEYLLENVWE